MADNLCLVLQIIPIDLLSLVESLRLEKCCLKCLSCRTILLGYRLIVDLAHMIRMVIF